MAMESLKMSFRSIMRSEYEALTYFREDDVFPSTRIFPCKGDSLCGSDLCEKQRKKSNLKKLYWKFSRKACLKKLLVRDENAFFAYCEASFRLHARVSLQDII